MSAEGTVLLTILIMPPPTSFLYLTRARSGSMPVVSQSIMKPMVPVGARTVTFELRGDEACGVCGAFGRGLEGLVDVVDLGAMHADNVEEGLAVDVEAGAGATVAIGTLRERRGSAERRAGLGDAGGLRVGVAAEDGGDGGGEGAAGVGVVGQAEIHEQSAEVGVAEAQRAVVVRVAADLFGGVAGGDDDDLHRGGDDGDGVAVGEDVELAAGGEELHQVEAGEIAGGVVEEHVLRTRIRR